MAKAPPPKASTPSRIRFVMVEAELNDPGDLSQITTAIQNALRPAPTSVRLTGPASTRASGNGAAVSGPTVVEVEDDDVVEQDTDVEVQESTRAVSDGPKRARKVRAPEVLDLDLTTEPSFAQFAEERKPTSNLKRYLTVAAWFKLHRGLDAITVDHVYTCFRSVKWQSDIADFAQPLRDLKAKKFLGLKEKGHYAINHIGLQEVEDLNK